MTTQQVYTVIIANNFEASTPEEAISQMVTWLQDHAHEAGYRVAAQGQDDSVFIDASTIDFDPPLVDGD
jgi:hypothetical protein